MEDRINSGALTARPDRSWIFLALVIIAVAMIRVHLLDLPLERDEGEYAYAGSLLLKGIPPYIHAYNMKLPGIYAAYAVIIGVFGNTHTGVHAGLIVVNIITVVLLFFLGKKILTPLAGTMAGAAFAVLSLNVDVLGPMANAEHFVILFAVAGLLALVHGLEPGGKRRLFLSGILLGTGVMMKQHGVFYVLFASIYLLWSFYAGALFDLKETLRAGAAFVAGTALPFAATCLVLYLAGAFTNFWFWTFTYAGEYVSQVPLWNGVMLFKRNFSLILRSSLPVWIMTAVGIGSLALKKNSINRTVFLLGLLFLSFLSTAPGLFFRPHYFVLTLPAVALLAGAGIDYLSGFPPEHLKPARASVKPAIAIFLASVTVAITIYQDRATFFLKDPVQISRTIYGPNPFPESIAVAEYIKANSNPDDYIAVLGSEPQIYFYSGRPSATGYIYMYPLTEDQRYAPEMQKGLIKDIVTKKPLFITFVRIPTSWLLKPGSDKEIFKWFKVYAARHYEKVGVIDIYKDATDYFWDEEARGRIPGTQNSVIVFKRRSLEKGRETSPFYKGPVKAM
ncbi:MAG: ArnT family glycosyltransferase [Thermodesulfobacteriota bacterium]